MGATRRQCLKNSRQHVIGLAQDIIVPEPQHHVTLPAQEGIAPFVVRRIHVLSTVELNQKAGLQAGEVGDVRTDRMLPAETEAAEPIAAQAEP